MAIGEWQKRLQDHLDRSDLRSDRPVDDDESNYAATRKRLPSRSCEALDALKGSAADTDFSSTQLHWVLCSMPEGEFPRVTIYPELLRLVDAIANLEGEETAVWAMYGVPLQLTQLSNLAGDKVRYLLLPDQAAVVVSSSPKLEVLAQSKLPDDILIQEDGWLGSPEFVNSGRYFTPGFETYDDSEDTDIKKDDNDDTQPEVV